MVSTCANPECSTPFRHLRQGRLFLVDPRDRRHNQPGWSSSRLEFFWLCEQCKPRFTLAVGPGERVSCVSRSESERVIEGRRFSP
jgi:hypothetical protein